MVEIRRGARPPSESKWAEAELKKIYEV